MGDMVTETATNLLQPATASLVFHSVVQESSDCLVLAPPSSRTRKQTASKWLTYGMAVPLRSCVLCTPAA